MPGPAIGDTRGYTTLNSTNVAPATTAAINLTTGRAQAGGVKHQAKPVKHHSDTDARRVPGFT